MTCWGDPEMMPMPSAPLPLGTKVLRVRVGDAVDEYLETEEFTSGGLQHSQPDALRSRVSP